MRFPIILRKPSFKKKEKAKKGEVDMTKRVEKKVKKVAGRREQQAIRQVFVEETTRCRHRNDIVTKFLEVNFHPSSPAKMFFLSGCSYYLDSQNLSQKKWEVIEVQMAKSTKVAIIESSNGHKLFLYNKKISNHNWYAMALKKEELDLLNQYFSKYVEVRHARLRLRPCELESGEIGFIIDGATPLR